MCKSKIETVLLNFELGRVSTIDQNFKEEIVFQGYLTQMIDYNFSLGFGLGAGSTATILNEQIKYIDFIQY